MRLRLFMFFFIPKKNMVIEVACTIARVLFVRGPHLLCVVLCVQISKKKQLIVYTTHITHCMWFCMLKFFKGGGTVCIRKYRICFFVLRCVHNVCILIGVFVAVLFPHNGVVGCRHYGVFKDAKTQRFFCFLEGGYFIFGF